MANERPITVAEARNLLWRYTTADQTDADGRFLFRLNQAVERVISSGVWEGEKESVDLSSYISNEVLSLPYAYDTMMGVHVDGSPRTIYSEDIEFSVNGPGAVDPGEGGNRIIDLGFETNSLGQSVRKYKFLSSADASAEVIGRCRKRFQYLVSDSDLVPIGNIGALKNAILCIHFEDEGDTDRAEIYWQRAMRTLNDERTLTHTGVNKPTPFQPFVTGSKPVSMY